MVAIDPVAYNIDGVNAGLGGNSQASLAGFPAAGAGTLQLFDGFDLLWDLVGADGFKISSMGGPVSPRAYASGDLIAGGPSFVGSNDTVFANGGGFSPPFGEDTYLGFVTAQGHCGWLEVTWSPSNPGPQFEILGGAYSDIPGLGVLAGGGEVSSVPESGTAAAAGLVALALGLRRRIRAEPP